MKDSLMRQLSFLWFLIPCSILCVSCSNKPQTPTGFHIEEGFQLKLVSSEPLIKDPVDFDLMNMVRLLSWKCLVILLKINRVVFYYCMTIIMMAYLMTCQYMQKTFNWHLHFTLSGRGIGGSTTVSFVFKGFR
jgi:hypothetical protein